ncbi:MAG: 3-hydroxyacyl-CoA dehydrogenase family protein [Paludibaculum sp.]
MRATRLPKTKWWRRCGRCWPVRQGAGGGEERQTGQLGNRMQMALVREAVNIVQEGIADAGDVDVAANSGFGLRLPVYGVLEHQDLVGMELGRQICGYVAADLNNEPKAPALFDRKITAGETGAAAGRGFHEWPAGLASEVKARRDRFLIDCLRRGVVASASPAKSKEEQKETMRSGRFRSPDRALKCQLRPVAMKSKGLVDQYFDSCSRCSPFCPRSPPR